MAFRLPVDIVDSFVGPPSAAMRRFDSSRGDPNSELGVSHINIGLLILQGKGAPSDHTGGVRISIDGGRGCPSWRVREDHNEVL
jgi:hypothetical protein